MSGAAVIHDPDDRSGVVESDDGERVAVRLPDGTLLHLPAALVARRPDGLYRADVSFETLSAEAARRADAPTVLREVEEHVRVRTDLVETGRVVARTVTETREEPVYATGWRETVEVEHVPVGRVVDAVEPVRVEDGVTVIPVYDEVLVVKKKLILREEVRLVTRREPVEAAAPVTLRRQTVEVERRPPADAGDPGP